MKYIRSALGILRRKQRYIFITLVAIVGTIGLLSTFAATTTATFSGRLSPKAPTKTHEVNVGASGTISAQLTYTKLSSTTVKLIDPSGATIATGSGSNPVILSSPVNTGNYKVSITGRGTGNYALNVTYPIPGDTVNPVVTIGGPAANATVSGSIIVSGTSSDNVSISSVSLAVDGATYQAAMGTTNWTYALDTKMLANGSHAINVRAVDSSGNVGTASITFNVNNPSTDTTAPTISITNPAANATVSNSITVSGTAIDNISVSKVEVQIDGGAFAVATGTTNWTYALDTKMLSNANHAITAKATDAAGLTKTTTVPITVNNTTSTDSTPPSAPAIPTWNTRTITSINLSWINATDDVGVKDYILYRDNQPVATVSQTSYKTSFNDTDLFYSTKYTYFVKAQDAAGNIGPASPVAEIYTNPDTTPPTTPTNLRATVVSSSRVELNWDASSDDFRVTDYLIYRNGTQVSSTMGTSTFDSGMKPGSTAIYTIIARDVKQNLSIASGAASVTIPADNTPPRVSILSPVNGATVGAPATSLTLDTYTVVSDETAVATSGTMIDGKVCGGASLTTLRYSCYIGNLSNGLHTLTSWATDVAGNRGEASVIFNLQNQATDTVRPTVSVVSPASASSVQGTVNIAGTASDNAGIKEVRISVNGNNTHPAGGIASGTNSWSHALDTTKLFNGIHTLQITAYDTNGIYNYVYLDINVNNPLNPSQSWTSPEGLQIQIASGYPYTTEYVYQIWKQNAIAAGNIAEVAPKTTIRIDPLYAATASVGATSDDRGGYESISCSIAMGGKPDYIEKTLTHEYGHCWTLYHKYVSHRGQMDTYMNYRWANGDGSVKFGQDLRREGSLDSSWASGNEVIAEDFRLLFGSPLAIAQLNHNGYNASIPDARYEPMKLKDWFLNVWVKPE